MSRSTHPAFCKRNLQSVGTFGLFATLAAAAAVVGPGYWLVAALACYVGTIYLAWPLVDEFRKAKNSKALKNEFWIGVIFAFLLLLLGTILLLWHHGAEPGNVNVSGTCNVTGNGNNVTCTLPPSDQTKQTLELSKLEIRKVDISGPTASYDLTATVPIKNASRQDATITRFGAQFVYTGNAEVLTTEQENEDWQSFAAGLKRNDKSTLQILGRAAWKADSKFTVLGKEEYESFLAGDYLIYFLFLLEYRDDNLAPGKHRMTELCYFFQKDFSRLNLCRGHNRTYISD